MATEESVFNEAKIAQDMAFNAITKGNADKLYSVRLIAPNSYENDFNSLMNRLAKSKHAKPNSGLTNNWYLRTALSRQLLITAMHPAVGDIMIENNFESIPELFKEQC